jgi:hypothetical protein
MTTGRLGSAWLALAIEEDFDVAIDPAATAAPLPMKCLREIMVVLLSNPNRW